MESTPELEAAALAAAAEAAAVNTGGREAGQEQIEELTDREPFVPGVQMDHRLYGQTRPDGTPYSVPPTGHQNYAD